MFRNRNWLPKCVFATRDAVVLRELVVLLQAQGPRELDHLASPALVRDHKTSPLVLSTCGGTKPSSDLAPMPARGAGDNNAGESKGETESAPMSAASVSVSNKVPPRTQTTILVPTATFLLVYGARINHTHDLQLIFFRQHAALLI